MGFNVNARYQLARVWGLSSRYVQLSSVLSRLLKGENKMEDKNKNRLLGYKLGAIFSSIVFACLAAIVIALTLKFIFWLF